MRGHRLPLPGLLLVAGLTLGVVGTSAAAGSTPLHGTFPINDSFTDDGASGVCGFQVTATESGQGRFEVFFDTSGMAVRVQVHADTTTVFSANGRSVTAVGHANTKLDLVNGTETDTGLIIRADQPTGGPLYLDRGRLVFDPDGNVVFEAGPHPSLHGDFGGLCASLAP
jgi:hypothetical protein